MKFQRAVLLYLLVAFSIEASSQIDFKESSASFNVIHKMNEWSVGSGVSVFDFNQDGLDDLTLGTEAGRPLGFFLNKGSRFEKIEPLVDNQELVKQILWVDYDNDGDPDLYVAAFDGINRLYKNKGDFQFADITEFSQLPLEEHRGYGAAFGDYNRDGWLDLYYVSRDIPGSEDFLNKNRLFENNADGTFTEITFEANADDAGNVPFCAAFIDVNNDMWPDLYIANDKYSTNAMLLNNQNRGFRNISQSSKTDFSMNAMCVNAEDYNNDGLTDIYVTNTTEGSKCLLNLTEGPDGIVIFEDVAEDLGITYFGNTGWGSQFFDADNDGDLDLYVSGAVPDDKKTSSAFFENEGARFSIPDIKALREDTTFSYANAIGDLNDDGYPEVIVQNNTPDRFFIWDNYTRQKNSYLKVKLTGVKSNKDGIGSRLDIYMDTLYQTKFTKCGSGFLGQNSLTKIIGCGNYTTIDSIIVTWSSGHIDKYFDIPVNQNLEFIEGETTDNVITTAPGIEIKIGEIKTKTLEAHFENNLEIFPNPASELLQIKTQKSIDKILLYDINGRLITEYNLAQTKNIQVPIDHLIKGIYLIEAKQKGKSLSFAKFVKI